MRSSIKITSLSPTISPALNPICELLLIKRDITVIYRCECPCAHLPALFLPRIFHGSHRCDKFAAAPADAPLGKEFGDIESCKRYLELRQCSEDLKRLSRLKTISSLWVVSLNIHKDLHLRHRIKHVSGAESHARLTCDANS